MAFDCNNNINNQQRKPLLFSDLFKSHGITSLPTEATKLQGSSCSSSSTQFLSSYDSSSSGFSTPDLGSSESEDGDFIAELTRQMAECMLQEKDEDEEEDVVGSVSQVYEVKNKPPVSKKGPLSRGRRVKGTESAQHKQIHKTELLYTWRKNAYSGSGMQAFFLGGSGPRIGSPGTGVFLPRDPSQTPNKSGSACSTVLIPTRVLQVLEELHLRKIQSTDSASPTTPLPSPQDMSTISNGSWDVESGAMDNDEMQLPQEWTY